MDKNRYWYLVDMFCLSYREEKGVQKMRVLRLAVLEKVLYVLFVLVLSGVVWLSVWMWSFIEKSLSK